MKRTLNRLLLRFSFLCVAVALGAIAVAHANRGLPAGGPENHAQAELDEAATAQVSTLAAQPIPVTDMDMDSGPSVDSAPDVQPAAPGDWSSPPAAGRVTLSPESTNEFAPIAHVDYDDPSSEPDFAANDGGFYAGPEPDFGTADAAGPSLEQPAPNFDEPSFDQPAPSEPSFEAPQFGGADTPTNAGADFSAGNDIPAYEIADRRSADPLPLAADDNTFAETPPAESSFESAEPAQPEPAFGGAEPALAAPSQPAESRIPSPPVGSGNHLRSGDSFVGAAPPTQPQPRLDEPSFAAPARAAAPRQEFATPAPAARPESDGFGGGSLAVANAGMHSRSELRTPSTSISITDPEPPLADDLSAGAQGSGKPGPSEIEGPQTPSLMVHKTAPPEIQVGKVAEFQVAVRNVGTVAAHEVLLRDEIPHGTELVDTEPPARQSNDGAIVWELGSIKPGDEVVTVLRVMPKMEGEIGSVATVSFQASASTKTRCTRPQLVIEHGCPRQVLIGENVVFSIKLSNPGTGAATNVVLEEDVPEGLAHGAGPQLEYAVGTLRPGETRLLELTLKAAKPGVVNNLLFAKADSSLVSKHNCELEVVAPALQVGVDGPALRYLERPAKYNLKVANPGTAPARGVKLVAHLPKGMKFSNANNAGYYRQQDHSVVWNLAELPAKEMGSVELTTIPLEMGEQKIRLQGAAQMELADSDEHTTTVEGLAALLFTLADINDPIEVGGQTTYEIKVVNQGSKAATNLRLGARMPQGLKPINGDGPSRATVTGQDILFEPVARLAPQGELSYKVHAEGTGPGDMRVEVQLISDEITEPIRKEESTHVYSDQ